MRDFFGCGRISSKGSKSDVMTYAVSGIDNLVNNVIPFFEQHPLRTDKGADFEKFRDIVAAMRRKEHRTEDGFTKIVTLAFSMNKRGKQRRYTIEEISRNPQRLYAEHS